MPCVRQQKVDARFREGTREVTENVEATCVRDRANEMLKPSTLEEVEGGEEA